MLVIESLYTWFKVLLVCLVVAVPAIANSEKQTFTIDANSGLVVDKLGQWQVTHDNCTSCHSASLLKQQRLDREGWLKVIRRMQREENLWPLGASEVKIIDYLSRYYGTESRATTIRPRRALLRVKD